MKLSKLRRLLDWKDWLAIILGVGATCILGLSNITRWSIWFDEAFSEHITRHSFVDIAKYTIADVHPPLYYWVLKVWRMIFGSSELALRSLSLLFLALATVMVYVLVRQLFSRRAAIFSLILLVLSPMLFRYGIEVRMYTMELCIVIAATAALIYAVNKSSRKAWILYGVLVGLGMLTHYLSIVVWAAHAAWLLYQNRRSTIKNTVHATLGTGYGKALIAGAAVVAVWVPFMVWQVINIQGGGFWIGAVTFNTVPNLLSNIYTYKDSANVQGWWVVAVAALIAASVYAVYTTFKSYTGEKRRAYSLLIASVVLPPAFLILGSMPPLRSAFVDRYLLASIALWFIVTGIALAHLWSVPRFKKPVRVIMALLVAVLLTGIYEVYTVGNINKDNGSIHTMRQAMQLANGKAEGAEPIVADSSWRYFEASYYEQTPHTVYFRSEDNTKVGAYEMLRGETDHKILVMSDFGKEHPIAWFVTAQARGDQSKLPRGWREIKTYLLDNPSELRVVKMQYIGDGLTGQ